MKRSDKFVVFDRVLLSVARQGCCEDDESRKDNEAVGYHRDYYANKMTENDTFYRGKNFFLLNLSQVNSNKKSINQFSAFCF